MKMVLPLLVAVLAVSGCTGPASPPSQQPEPVEEEPSGPPTAPQEEPVNMSGSISLKFYEPDVGDDQPRGATFEVSSPQSSMLEDGVWMLTPAKAIVYGKDGEETLFEADSARFDDNSKMASLEGSVSVNVGTQHVELEEMTWSNDGRVARSERPVKVVDDETQLTAAGMEYHAETRTLLLYDVTGSIRLNEGSTAP